MRRVVALAVAAAVVATPLLAGALAAGSGVGGQRASAAPDATEQTRVESADDVAVDGQRRTAGTSQTIEKHIELSLTPDEPGAVDVEVTYDVPDAVTALRVSVPGDARDVRSSSFSPADGQYEWNGETDPASLSFTLPANQSARGARAPSVAQDGEYSFVDVGPWAMVTVPGLRTGWEWRGPDGLDVTLSESVGVAGEGSTGGEIAFLGAVETYERTANDQRFELAVPEAASLRAPPEAILDALTAAAGRFHVGERDAEVWFAAAPTGADWGVRGVEYGGSDAWVTADASLEDAGNVWFHEYVHTRQAFSTAPSGQWTTEAAAEYYSALLALRTGYVSFDAFETYLSYGERDPWRDAVLAVPDTWSRGGANYVKGALVWGAIDRQVRLETNSTHTMADVFYRLNRQDASVTNGDVLTAVGDVSSTAVREYALEYTETEAAPEMWTRSQHAAAFDVRPPRMEFEVREYRVEGPFRNESSAAPPTLYVGETLTVEATVTNDGGRTGEYEASLSGGGDVLAAATGSLEAGERDRVTLTAPVDAAGTYNLSVGRTPVSLTAREPAPVEVSDLSVSPASVDPGGDVTATVRLSNPSEDYARGSVDVTLDGERVATLDVTLAPGRSTTRTVTATLPESGRYEFAAGERSASVTAGSGDGNGTGATIPGFGVGAAVAAVAAAALLAGRE